MFQLKFIIEFLNSIIIGGMLQLGFKEMAKVSATYESPQKCEFNYGISGKITIVLINSTRMISIK